MSFSLTTDFTVPIAIGTVESVVNKFAWNSCLAVMNGTEHESQS